MKTLETQNFQLENNKSDISGITETKDNTKEHILNTLDAKQITEDLAKVFGLNKEQVTKLTQVATVELSDKVEVNKNTYDLAGEFDKLLGRNDIKSNMVALNNKDYVPVKSYAGVA